MPVLARTKVDENNRTTIPREVRKLLELKDSNSIEWVYEEGRVYVRKVAGDGAAKLLILGPTYRRSTSPEPLPAIERYDGLLYRIVRRNMDKVKKKGVDIVIVTEDLEIITPKTKLPYKPPAGSKWRTLPPTIMDSKRIEKLRSQVLEIVRSKEYDEIFVALNKHYRQLLPDLTPYTKKVIADFKGLGEKAKALKEWLSR